VTVGGRGGAGATVLAVALGLAGLRAGLRMMLIDADPLGGGIDLALGVEDTPGLRWADLSGLRGRLPGAALGSALPTVGEMTVLSFGRDGHEEEAIPPEAMRSLLEAGCRGSDLVIVDLPRWQTAAGDVALSRARTALLVVPAEVRACAAAARVAAVLGAQVLDLRVVVRGPGPSRLAPATIAAALGLPLAAAFRTEPGLALALERGEPPGRSRGSLSRAATRLVTALTDPGNRVAA
jgi:secretion/DNA translocation related CpaE-like protein